MKRVILVGVPGMNDREIESIERYIKEEVDADFQFLGKNVLPREELVKKAKDADIIITWDQKMDDELYKELNLCAFCAASTGFNVADIVAATRNGVMVTNAKDYCVDEVSGHAVMLILACSRKLAYVTENVKRGNWNIGGIGNIKRFSEATVGIFAFGSIARAVAEKLNGFGVRMISYDPYVSKDIMEEYGVEKVDFDSLLIESDYITLHAPLTDETEGIFNYDALVTMKQSAYIINTARGRLIDQDSLYELLKGGRIAGAGLDVIQNEPPLEKDKELIKLPDVIVTPHSAYFSDKAQEMQLRITARDVVRIIRGEIPINLRNPEVLDSEKFKK